MKWMHRSRLALLAASIGTTLVASAQTPPAPTTAPSSPLIPTAPVPDGTRVSMSLKAASPKEVFSELARQSDAQLRTYPKDLWESRTWDDVDVDLKGVTFWSAIKELGDKTSLSLQRPGPDREMVISQLAGPGWRELPGCESGVFYVSVGSVYRQQNIDLTTNEIKRTCNLRLTLYAEPKVRVLRGPSMTVITEAIDENGVSLNPQSSASDRNPNTGHWSWPIPATLAPPANVGKRIALLRGTSKLLVQTRSQVVEVPDILHAAAPVREAAGRQLRIRSVSRNSTETFTVSATLTRLEGESVPWADINFLNTFRLYDADGNPLARRNYGTTTAGASNTLDLSMVFARDEGQTGEPTKLVWEVPTEMAEITVPFEFRNLPLP